MTETLVQVHDLTVEFPGQKLFNHLSFNIDRGEFLSVIGENGVGKTTLIRTLLHQVKPTHGEIKFRSAVNIGYVPQFRNIDRDYPLSIRDFVALNLQESRLPWLSKKERQQLDKILQETGLVEIQNTRMGRASGGQKQRAYLAQALVDQPDLLILDESTASLDSVRKYELFDLVQHFNRRHGLTVLSITHDFDLMKKYSDKYLLLKEDRYALGEASDIHSEEDLPNV
ncbi:metal ABC transporter ATP-binding protein [Pediococcus acidilactici]|uniref:metal ABC transporter ATP-binding protein n=1 Tax=Pediococcus acidilactici TaxID=1254 RepID=UPI0013306A81|nr:ATP-binding cassette domain-containing protein [Pediococcus acidilactici]KAF0379509.1 ATP-binding cassette domain-containing protein [Pediococcus acidilactici]KAF0550375.1 ATP-binding cassette domain-containing protein [Pediococcus acidilactici]